MSVGTLYLGTVDTDFTTLDTLFLTDKNFNEVLESNEVYNCHSSIEDLGLGVEKTKHLLNHCDNIELLNHEELTSIHYAQRDIMLLLADTYANGKSNIADLLVEATNGVRGDQKADQVRPTDDPVLWVTGCSWAKGDGVGVNQRFSHIVAEELGLPEVNKAISGGSIWTASDQILRADVREGDTIIWGLTSTSRCEIVTDNGELKGMPSPQYLEMLDKEKQYHNIDYFDSAEIKMKWGRQIQQVINFCNKISAKLHIINFLDYARETNMFLKDKTVPYLDLFEPMDTWPDIAPDGLHPGPMKHKQIAKEIIKLIKGETKND